MKIKDLLFINQSLCQMCLSETLDSGYICNSCRSKLEYAEGKAEIGDYICNYLYFYNNFIRSSFKRYKFEKKSYLSKAFSELLLDYILEKQLYEDIDAIVIVPMTNKSIVMRGYNQVSLIAERISQKLKIPVIEALEKSKSTKEQNKISTTERSKNIKGSISLIKDRNGHSKVEGLRILLLDDFLTTGNTLKSCCNVLEEVTESITCLVLASVRGDEL